MPAPTQEQFDAAPLYRAILPAPGEVERDWSLHELVVGGLSLTRTDTDVGGFEVRLEGVPIAVGAPHEEEDWQGYRIQYLSSDTETMMHADDRDEALRRLGRLVERAVFSQDEILFMRLRGQGVDLDRILEALRAGPPLVLPVAGADLVARGLAPGRGIGRALARARARWLALGCPLNPEARDALIAHALEDAVG